MRVGVHCCGELLIHSLVPATGVRTCRCSMNSSMKLYVNIAPIVPPPCFQGVHMDMS